MAHGLDEAWAAFARSDWEAARDHFQRALDVETSTSVSQMSSA